MLFVYIKSFRKKNIVNHNECLQQKTTCTFLYIQKAKKTQNVFIYKNRDIFKKQDNFRCVLYTKSETLYIKRFFITFLKLTFIYRKHDILCYMTFLYTKSQTLRKNQDNLCYSFIYKNPDTLRYAIFH